MCRNNKLISRIDNSPLTRIVLVLPLLGIVSSEICSGQTNHVISSPHYTTVNIVSLGRSSCTWVIEQVDCDNGGTVGVQVSFFGEFSITIYDGPSSQYPVIGKYNHFILGSGIDKRSSGRFMTVHFTFSPHSYNRFHLRYRNTPKGLLPSRSGSTETENSVSDTCGEILLVAYQKPNFITSPGYPREYGNSLDCKWTVKSDDVCNDDVIQITIHTLALEVNYDHLVIYDGDSDLERVLTKLSGHGESQVIMASGKSVVIQFKTDDTAPGRGFHLSYIRTKASPSISPTVVTKVSKGVAEMSVDFMSSTPHTAVDWSRLGRHIQQEDRYTFRVTSAKVGIASEPGVVVDGFTATMVITDLQSSDFGNYNVGVRNKFGVSERLISLRRGSSAPDIRNYTVFSENATIMVMFSSHTNFEVEWYKSQHILNTGSDVAIATKLVQSDENGNENEDIYMAMLSRVEPTELDYGEYMCIIRNDIGSSEISVNMDLPRTELPRLLTTPLAVQMSDKDIILTVNFDSNIAYPTATWYHGNVQLENATDKYRQEMTWKGILSSNWFTYGYPTHQNQSDVDRSYDYPSIGSTRTSTVPNANYTALLTISMITSDDFGPYRVVLRNDAGITHHVIDVTIPEVFPYATCDQSNAIQLVCNVTSCSITQSWIHSVDGDVIRKLPGDQDGTINTLSIPTCMYSDAGTYTCVAKEEETGNDIIVHHNRTKLTVRAVPQILESTVDVTSTRILIAVPFYSLPPYRRVTWYRNEKRISSSDSNVIETEPHDVNLPVHFKTFSRPGHKTSINVSSPSAEDYGVYHITISNEIGSSEYFINVQNPEYANPITSSDVGVTYDRDSALLNVNFTSHYPNFSLKWYFRGVEVQINHPINKYQIQTEPSGDHDDPNSLVRTKHSISSILTVTCLTAEDYGMYDAILSNEAGQAVIPVKLIENGQGIPEIVQDMTTDVTNSTGQIWATFHSLTGYRRIRWLKGNEEITNDSLKYHIVNNDIDIVVSSNGETVEKTGTITRLRVTSFEDKDYGRYTVQIYNDVGMTDRSVTLHEEC
ncbi:titin-like [Ylistrum balloti]|uniref:titin-like n=1 Tax=Ylistrum balloti TaxID=509963 RepID=UPI0029059EAD|nr:titin-like [Ylistrum balloti]